MKALLGCAILAGLLLAGCQKAEEPVAPQLPAVTTTGANTLGCRINGAVWVAEAAPDSYTGEPHPPAYLASYNERYRSFTLVAQRVFPWGRQERLTFRIYQQATIDHYFLGNKPGDPYGNNTAELDSEYYTFMTDEAHTGELVITKLDTVAGILAGTFQFAAGRHSTQAPAPQITITDGRFDIKYK